MKHNRGAISGIAIILLSLFCPITIQSATNICSIGRPVKVALLGDSLMRHAFVFLDLANQIKIELKKLNSSISVDNIDFNCTAEDSSMIKHIRDFQLWPAVELQPDATFIFWDTDVSDISEWGMNAQDAEDLRNTFRLNVDFVVASLLNYTNSQIALTGPGVLGEDRVIKQSNFWHKTTMIDEYLDIVSDICASRNVTYINLRQPYLQNVPIFKGSLPGFSYSRLFVKAHYFVSEDGEHPNFRACSIIAEKFASLLYTWFYSSC